MVEINAIISEVFMTVYGFLLQQNAWFGVKGDISEINGLIYCQSI
jgi:hypothetical protein